MKLFQQLRKPAHIAIGSKWVIRRNDGDPFPPSRTAVVKVLDVKDGWVRYTMLGSSDDNRREIDMFLYIYEPHIES